MIDTLAGKLSPDAAPRLCPPQQAASMQPQCIAPQLSSLLASFQALCITRTEVKKSVIHKRRAMLNGKASRRCGKRLPTAGDDDIPGRVATAKTRNALASSLIIASKTAFGPS